MKKLIVVFLFGFVLSAAPTLARLEPVKLIVVTHDSFNVTEKVLTAFETDHNIKVEILKAGDAGAMTNKAILSKANPLGDVLYGVDNTFLGRALKSDIFEPYESPLLKNVPEEFQLDARGRVTPVDYGDVCLNYDVAYFEKQKLAIPQNLLDLTKPEYKSLLAVQNPATSSPGLAFLIASVAQFGTANTYTYLNFWGDLVKNDVYVSPDWSDAYYNQFSAGGQGGPRPLVVSYASSIPFTVDQKTGRPTTGSIVADGTCFRQIEFVGILKGTKNTEAAQKFVDFMLSTAFQEDMPMQMFVFPVNKNAKLPEDFAKFALIPEKPAAMRYEDIDAKRDEWIKAWTETVLR
jgi:thiamine transport system substrate-binding protein